MRVIQTHITRKFLSKSQKHCIYLPPVQHKSRSLRLVDQSNIYTGYVWIMCATFGVCFKFPTLLVIDISDKQKSGN